MHMWGWEVVAFGPAAFCAAQFWGAVVASPNPGVAPASSPKSRNGVASTMSSDTDCYAPAANDLLGLRIGGLFGILAVSTIGVSIPYFTYTAKLGKVYFILRAFAAGVVVTTG